MKARVSFRFLAGTALLFVTPLVSGATFFIADDDVAGLIAAMNTANGNNQDDTINLAVKGTYTLTAVNNTTMGNNGLPVIVGDNNHSLVINGNGATITRSAAAGTPFFRLFRIDNYAFANSNSTTLSALTLNRGYANAAVSGGGNAGKVGGAVNIESYSVVNINDCIFTNNHADVDGGAISNHGDPLTLNRCTLRNNSAQGGGAIFNFLTLIANGCSLNGNFGVGGPGAALSNFPGTIGLPASAKFNNCTFDNNTRDSPSFSGDGIFNSVLANTIAESSAEIILTGCTVSRTDIDNSGVWTGGPPAGSRLRLRNTIIVASELLNSTNQGNPYTEIISDGYNLSDGNGGGFLTAPGDQINTNPGFDPAGLQDNGGLVKTFALLLGSPAIDSGRAAAFGLTTDARGLVRPFDVASAPNINGSDGSDIGAYEYNDQLQAGPNFTVNLTADDDDGLCGPTDCTLREAINAANAQSDDSTIKFAPNVTGAIDLTSALPNLSTDLTVQGPGANLLSVHRLIGGNYRIFTISNGTTTGPRVTLSGLTLSNGVGTGSGTPGGAIMNSHGNLTVSACTISGNSGGNGAGLSNDGSVTGTATATLLNSTFRNNTAGSFGGAIFNSGATGGQGTLFVTNCTIADNSASRGAAIYNTGISSGVANTTILNCTISNNSASFSGGIYSTGTSGIATVSAGNAIFKTGASGGNFTILNSTFGSQGHNLSNDAAGGDAGTGPGGFLNGTGDKRNTDPLLDPAGLKKNGGPTETVSPLGNSPVINAGDNALAPSQDQRGLFRSGISDIGALEVNGKPFQITFFSRSAIGRVVLEAVGFPNELHTVRLSSDLDPNHFSALTPSITADANGLLHVEFNDPEPKRFYVLTYP